MTNIFLNESIVTDYKFIECYPYIENYCIDSGISRVILYQEIILSLLIIIMVYLIIFRCKNGKKKKIKTNKNNNPT
jgi:hypothetical protein